MKQRFCAGTNQHRKRRCLPTIAFPICNLTRPCRNYYSLRGAASRIALTDFTGSRVKPDPAWATPKQASFCFPEYGLWEGVAPRPRTTTPTAFEKRRAVCLLSLNGKLPDANSRSKQCENQRNNYSKIDSMVSTPN